MVPASRVIEPCVWMDENSGKSSSIGCSQSSVIGGSTGAWGRLEVVVNAENKLHTPTRNRRRKR